MKHGIAALGADLEGGIAGIFRHLWIMGAGIVAATVALMKILP